MLRKFFIFLLVLGISSSVDIPSILNSLTIEEKCGQMTQIAIKKLEKLIPPIDPDENPLDKNKLLEALRDIKIGSILDTPFDVAQKSIAWQKIIKLIQDIALNETKHKIPIIYGLDSIHGANYIREATLFPQPISLAATFNTDFVHRVGEITALETRSVGIPWNFNPVLDIGRQPLWPRLFETFGEDTYLASRMGEAYITGSQGNNLKNHSKLTTCLKHYIGYSFPLNGKDRTPAMIPENVLRETFLPSFQAGVLSGALTVMINSAEVNGIPGHSNSYYINDILKGELNFTGFVVSDWQDIERLYIRDKLAETPEDAVRISVMSGLDMSMVPDDYSFYYYCVNLTQKDSKFAQRVDDAVTRILNVKEKLGLFENPYPSAQDLAKIGTKESEDFNLEVAKESIILAKNSQNILPLNKSSNTKILVTGACGNTLRTLNGGWSYTWQGSNENHFKNYGRKKFSLYESIKNIYRNVEFSEGANFKQLTNYEETILKARLSDKIILCVGEDTYAESFGNIESLALSQSQITLANELVNLKKPIILVYFGGRPRIITDIVQKSEAVILGFLPGNRGAEAVADVLFGNYNPNGRLSISYPQNTNGFSTYDHKPLEDYDINVVRPLFQFGHGLSYTQFNYSKLVLSTTKLNFNETLFITVNVKNVGNFDGKESVLLFLNDECASVTRPVKQLKRFEKIHLAKGEENEVKFSLSYEDFSFIGRNNMRIVEEGKFHIFISDLKASFYLMK